MCAFVFGRCAGTLKLVCLPCSEDCMIEQLIACSEEEATNHTAKTIVKQIFFGEFLGQEISQGPRQVCLYKTLPFKPISLMSAIDSSFGDMRDTSIVVTCERASSGCLNLQTGLWCEDAHPKCKYHCKLTTPVLVDGVSFAGYPQVSHYI